MSNIAIDSKGKVNTNSVNVRKNAGTSYDRVEPANINDITPLPKILDEIENRLGTLPICIGLDAGYHNAATAHLPESRCIQAVIGYRRHTHAGEHFGKWRFRYDSYFDVYLCPKHQPLYWKTTTRQGDRQYFSDPKTSAVCPQRDDCFGKSAARRMVERHARQDAPDEAAYFTKTPISKQLYKWRKGTIERSFAEAKQNHGIRFARMLGLPNMREQCFLNAAVQNIKRLAKAFLFPSSFVLQRPCLRAGDTVFVDGLTFVFVNGLILCNNIKCYCFIVGLSLLCHFPTYRAGAKMSLVI